ncbi:hypothetical protein SAMN05446037_10071 [Anaerovirgula multivorans]|uniref:Uncharacterized protein n=1 Tax=Anaerovirgula multivorans TaxID=312168 RepID=A0A239D4T3_9FIRM|nr:hypothetical protein SAMN05446037_10071 [Anaerovirgula multivorans]
MVSKYNTFCKLYYLLLEKIEKERLFMIIQYNVREVFQAFFVTIYLPKFCTNN